MKRYAKWINADKNKEEIVKISNSAKEKGNQTIYLIPFSIFGGSGVSQIKQPNH